MGKILHINFSTTNSAKLLTNFSTFKIHHVSYLFYTFIGGVISIIVGTIVTFLLDVRRGSDPMLFSPTIRKFIKASDNLLTVRQNVNEKSCIVHAFEEQDNKVQ